MVEDKLYQRVDATPMHPWTPDESMDGVSVSKNDVDAGSPKAGDMIAHNPSKPEDRWLVAEGYFKAHFKLSRKQA